MSILDKRSFGNLSQYIYNHVQNLLEAPPGAVRISALGVKCIHVVPGTTYSFTCEEDEGFPRPTFTWYRNGALDPTTGRMELIGPMAIKD